jgi:hypothetical protein
MKYPIYVVDDQRSTAMPEADVRPHLRTWPAILCLAVLAQVTPETVLTFNTPPSLYLSNSIVVVLEIANYGSAAILLREVARRRSISWTAWLMLGIAYGFVNEGVLAGTWYTVRPQGYSFQYGIDWGWATALTIFHAIFSMTVPITLAEGCFPARAAIPWLGRRGRRMWLIILLLTCLLGVMIDKYRGYRVLALLAAITLTLIALRLSKATPLSPSSRPALTLWQLRLIGFGGYVLYFIAIFLVPTVFKPPTILIIAELIALLLLGILVVRRWARCRDWGLAQRVALASGPIGVSILLTPFFIAVGEPLAVGCYIVFLIWLARHIHMSTMADTTASIPMAAHQDS